MKQIGHCAIVTAFTPDFGDDFKLFHDSLRQVTKVNLIVIPLDHSAKQLSKLQAQGFHAIFHHFNKELLTAYRNIGSRWMQWFKPQLLKMMIKPYKLDTILWLDVDLVVLDDIKPLFEQAFESFFVIRDYFAPKDCQNDQRLYEKYPTPLAKDQEDVVLNSGVIGMHWPRDKHIIEDWLEKVWTIARNPELIDYISLYDQGALLWSMRDSGILDKILPKPEWNHKAIRNCYESDKTNLKWPISVDRCMGGDIIEEVKYDNPGVTIAHFAGLPKLSQLCTIDGRETCQYRRNKYKSRQITRIFGVGLERAGTHTLAETFRRANRTESWIRHEFQPSLSKEAKEKWHNKLDDTSNIQQRIDLYNRTDVQFVSEVNHRLSFFVPEIATNVKNSKFILLLRNPVTLIQSRLLNYSIWTRELYKFPSCYQFDTYSLHQRFGEGSSDQNQQRLRPVGDQEIWDLNQIEMHVWEIKETLRWVLRDLRALPENRYEIIWLEDLAESCDLINQLIPATLYLDKAKKCLKTRFGAHLPPNDNTAKWVQEQVDEHSQFILESVTATLKEFDVPLQRQVYWI